MPLTSLHFWMNWYLWLLRQPIVSVSRWKPTPADRAIIFPL